ncbi:hypothetical protein BV25DRAFT_1822244 [Artomyces pyxidatus]|uniref:Uncharacterized protein n=1 Tax=Artomyces pyxidatus TaxID=48021 RepID=A0ACB8T9J8_9AGAM|nr:hypothetical protein BV25DRAFT_1822244 [Artomyces pyxidatus]
MHFLDLPVELQTAVLRHLDHRSVLRCTLVCRQLHELVASSVELRYKVELVYDGLVDGAAYPPGMPYSRRLERLLDRRSAWRTLAWRKHTTVTMPGSCRAYELVGGIFAKVFESNGFCASRLPSATADERRLEIADLGVPVKDFAIDPTQGLIALLEQPGHDMQNDTEVARVHLRAIGEDLSELHPDAKCPVLEFRTAGAIHGSTIQIADDVVGIYFWTPLHGVLVWNWMTGERLVYFQGDHGETPEDIWDFALLSSRAYMVTTLTGGGTIEIYTFGDDLSRDSGQEVTLVATLCFFELHPMYGNLLIEATTTTGPFTARVALELPFGTAPTSRVHVFKLQYAVPGYQPVCLVVHNRTLMQYIENYRAGGGHVNVPWEAWGVDGSRAFILGNGSQWLRYVHGERVVCPILHDDRSTTFEVLDFNVHPTRDPQSPATDGMQLVTESSILPSRHQPLFDRPVVTCLPYRSVTVPDLYVGFMIDGERLLGLKASPFSSDSLGDIDVFSF